MATWGRSTIGTAGDAFFGQAIAQSGTFLNESGHTVNRIEVYVKSAHTAQVRLALYRGGTSDSDMDGATLVEDFGMTSGSATNQWVAVNSVTHPSLTANERLWLCIKGNDDGCEIAFDTVSANRGNLSSAGITYVGFNVDETVAYPATQSGGTGAEPGWMSVRLITDSGSGGTAAMVFGSSGVGAANATSSGAAAMAFTTSGVGRANATTAGSSTLTFNTSGVGAIQAVASGSTSFAFSTSGAGAVGASSGTAGMSFAASGVGAAESVSSGSASLTFNTSGVSATVVPIAPMSVSVKNSAPFELTIKTSSPFKVSTKTTKPFDLTAKTSTPFAVSTKTSAPFGLTTKTGAPL